MFIFRSFRCHHVITHQYIVILNYEFVDGSRVAQNIYGIFESTTKKREKRPLFSHRDFNNLSRKKYFLINIMNRWIPLLLCLQKFVFFLLLRSSCSVWLLNWFISKFKETEAKSMKKFLFCFQMKFSRSNAFCRRRFNEISIFALIFHSNKSSEYVDVCVCVRDGIAKLIILQRI